MGDLFRSPAAAQILPKFAQQVTGGAAPAAAAPAGPATIATTGAPLPSATSVTNTMRTMGRSPDQMSNGSRATNTIAGGGAAGDYTGRTLGG